MSSFAFSKKIAGRYLWSRRAEAFISIITVISVLGVAIGVMVLNIVMAVMTGFEHELSKKLVDAESHITVKHLSGGVADWQAASDKLAAVSGVSTVSPFTYHQVLFRSEAGSTGLLVKGIAEGSPSADKVAGNLEGGRTIDLLFHPDPVRSVRNDGTVTNANLPALVVGRKLAQTLVPNPGASVVSLISTAVGSTPFGLVPRYKRFVVVATYHSGLVEYENNLAYLNLAEAQKFFRMGDTVSGFEIQVDDFEKAPQVAKQLIQTLGGHASGFYATDWIERNKPLWEALNLEKKVYFIVLLLIIVMASFSIVTTLIMIVLEKRRDIAILKTMGASTKSIANIFRIHGSVIGALGTGLGLLLGFLGCIGLREYGFPLDERIFPVAEVPVRIEPLNFLIVGVAAFLICFFATVYPARRASRLEPSEVLRYE